ncbi:uncharacterized protein LOC128643485 [Bombina bombina]|uniref:uncharacterized protein LOC128643485 n=1 Tax=Bombina bombina TaxID=8345 RepID=UPI00235AD745|nr:uncharacterized protein LOC128643485 [Bombina bombina]
MKLGLFFIFFLHQTSAVLELTDHSNAILGANALIPCTFNVGNLPIKTEFLAIIWYFQGKEILNYDDIVKTSHPRVSLNINKLTDGIASLLLSNVTISDSGIYKCSVIYSPEKKETEVMFDVHAIPKIIITNNVVIQNKESFLNSTITGFYPIDIDIKWLRDKEVLESVTHYTPQRHYDGTYSVKSSVIITPTKENEKQTYSIRVLHTSLHDSIQKDFQLVYGDPPRVRISYEVINGNTDYILRCLATGFYPAAINITWIRDGEVLQKSLLGKLGQNQNGTYNVESSVTMTKCPKEQILSCRVQHASLKKPLQENFILMKRDEDDKPIAVIVVCCVLGAVVLAGVVVLWIKHCQKKALQRFTLSDINGPQKLIDGEEVTLCCTCTGCTGDMHVMWLEDRIDHVCEIAHTQSQDKEESENLLGSPYLVTSNHEEPNNLSSSLRFIPSIEKHRHVTFICRFICGGKVKEKQFVCNTIYAKPQMLEPVKSSLCPSGEILYSLNLQRFYPKNINISWIRRAGDFNKTISAKKTFEENPNGTFNVCSEVKISEDHMKDPSFSVQATWEHESLDTAGSETLAIKDFIWKPKVEEIRTPLMLHETPVTLQCKISRYFPDALTVIWLKREEGSQELTEVTRPDIKSHRDQDKTYSCTASLTVTPTLSTDQGAEYICRVQHPTLVQPIERSTGKLTVMAKPQILEPVKPIISASGEILYRLKLQRFYPKAINISWTSGVGDSHKTKSSEIFDENPDTTFNVCSEVRIPGDHFRDKSFSVLVTCKHKSMDKPETTKLSIKDSDFIWKPKVEEIQTPLMLHKTPVTLQCKISRYFPDALTVRWLRREEGSQELTEVTDRPDIKSHRDQDNTYSCTTSLTVTPTLSTDQGAEYICRVLHPTLVQPIERSTGKLIVMAKPQAMEPIKIESGASSRVKFSLNLQRFHPNEIEIKWKHGDCLQHFKESEKKIINTDETFSALSECNFPGHLFNDPTYKIAVIWNHVTIDNPESRELSVRDFPWKPELQDIIVPRLEANKKATIKCNISNYFPDNLTADWLIKETGSDVESALPDGYHVSVREKHTQEDGTLTCQTCVTFTPNTKKAQIVEFICRVNHPTLEKPKERRTRPLIIGGSNLTEDEFKVNVAKSQNQI